MKDASISTIKESYNGSYSNYDEQWRLEGGRNKALNIISLCESLNATNMLDVGSGDGAVLSWLSHEKFAPEIYALDISESGLTRIKEKNIPQLKEATLFDGYHIPYEDKRFELATCSHVLEHVEHPRLLLREIARVSDYQFFEIPIDFSFFVDQKLRHFLSYGHINIFTPSLFKFLIKSEGFEIVKEDFRFYSDAILKMTYPKGQKRLISRIKNTLVAAIPFLKHIKPNVYVVLCRKTESGLKVF